MLVAPWSLHVRVITNVRHLVLLVIAAQKKKVPQEHVLRVDSCIEDHGEVSVSGLDSDNFLKSPYCQTSLARETLILWSGYKQEDVIHTMCELVCGASGLAELLGGIVTLLKEQ